MMIVLLLISFDPFYFIHYSDPQIGRNAYAQPNFETAVDQISVMYPTPRFMIVAGDMGNNPENQSAVLNQWEICDSLCDLLPMPIYAAPGNNDVGYEDEGCWTPSMLQFYRAFWGPDYYSFDSDSCHIIALNSTLLDTYSSHACYPYSLEQDSFLLADLQGITPGEYRHIFFFFHFPLYQTSPNDPNGRSVVDRPRRDSLLQDIIEHDVAAVFTGHWHVDYLNFYWPAVLQTGIATCVASGSAGYRAVKVFQNGLETFIIPLLSPVDTLSLSNIVMAWAGDDTVDVNVPVMFSCDVDTVNNPGWNNLSFRWIFGDGDSATTAQTTHTYTDTGTYQVIFTAYHLHDKCAMYRLPVVVQQEQHVHEERAGSVPSFAVATFIVNNVLELHCQCAGTVTIDLYSANGRFVETMHDGYLGTGIHHFTIGQYIPSGVYFLRFRDDESRNIKKVLIVR